MSFECPHCRMQLNKKQAKITYNCFTTYTCSVSEDYHRVIYFEQPQYNTLYKAVIKKVQEIWAIPLQWQYTDHSAKHSARVFRWGEKLMFPLKGTQYSLEPEEILLFILAGYLHDIGMQRPDETICKYIKEISDLDEQYRKKDDMSEDRLEEMNKLYDNIRKEHAKRAPEIINDVLNDIVKGDNSLKDLVRNLLAPLEYICRLHSGKYEELITFNVKDSLISGKKIGKCRIKMIAGILRFADELDLSSERVFNRSNLKYMPLSALSNFHWLKHVIVKNVDIDNQKIQIEFSYPPLSSKDEQKRKEDIYLYQQIIFWVISKLKTEWTFITERMDLILEGCGNIINPIFPDISLSSQEIEEDKIYEPFNPFENQCYKNKIRTILEKEIRKFIKPIKINLIDLMKEQGIAHYLSGEYSFSENTLSAVLDKIPDDIESLLILAEISFKDKKYEKTIEFCNKVIKLKPNFYDVLLNMGIAYNEWGKHEKAIECFEKILKIKPDDYRTLHVMGSTYRDAKNFDKALEYYDKALEINPGDYDLIYNMGSIYENLKDYDKAIEYYKRALSIKPDSAITYNTLGVTYIKMNDYDKAIKYFEKALSIDPNYSEPYSNMGLVHRELSNFHKALEYFEKALQIDPDSYETLYNMALILGDLNRDDEVMAYCEKVLKINPIFPGAYNLIGGDYLRKGLLEKAIKHFQKAIELNPEFYEAYNNLAIAYSNIKEFDKAIETFDKALAIKPDSYETFYNIGFAYLKMDKYEKAIEFYKKAIVINPHNYEPFADIGVAYIKLKQFEESIEFSKKALAIKDNAYSALYNLACAYSLKGDSETALNFLQKAIEKKEGYKEEALTDESFEAIWNLPEFQKIIGKSL